MADKSIVADRKPLVEAEASAPDALKKEAQNAWIDPARKLAESADLKSMAAPGKTYVATAGTVVEALPGSQVVAKAGSIVIADAGSYVSAQGEHALVIAHNGSHVGIENPDSFTVAESGSEVFDKIPQSGSPDRLPQVEIQSGANVIYTSADSKFAGQFLTVKAMPGTTKVATNYDAASIAERQGIFDTPTLIATSGQHLTVEDTASGKQMPVIAEAGSEVKTNNDALALSGSDVTVGSGSSVLAAAGSHVRADSAAHVIEQPGAVVDGSPIVVADSKNELFPDVLDKRKMLIPGELWDSFQTLEGNYPKADLAASATTLSWKASNYINGNHNGGDPDFARDWASLSKYGPAFMTQLAKGVQDQQPTKFFTPATTKFDAGTGTVSFAQKSLTSKVWDCLLAYAGKECFVQESPQIKASIDGTVTF
jgi:hypothetical protein